MIRGWGVRVGSLVVLLSTIGSSGAAEAQETTVDGKRAFCLGQSGVCVVGGAWTTTAAGFTVGSTEAEPVELRMPGELRFAITPGSSLSLSAGRDPSIDGTVGLGFEGTNGPLSGLAIRGPRVTLKLGRGSALSGRSFAVGSHTVRKESGWVYLYAAFEGATTMRVPGTTVEVPVPTPAEGLSSQLLVGIDPRSPNNLVFYLGGGFTALLTSQTVTDGSVLFQLGASTSLSLGSFRTTPTGNPMSVVMQPTVAAQGTLSLFSGDDANASNSSNSSGSQSSSSAPSNAQPQPRKRKPIPISIGGGLAIDFDGDRDGRYFESFADTRFGGNDVNLTIDDVGLGQSIEVGRGFFYYDPSATSQCGEVGRVLARVDSVQQAPLRDALASTPLRFLDPGSAGFRFDAAACGTASMVRLTAANETAGVFPLANASISFGGSGVSVRGTIDFLGSDVELRGTVDGRALRLRSSSALRIGNKTISNGSLELVLSETPSLRFRGYVELRDQRFAIDHTFTSPPTSFSLPEIEISQTIELPGVDVATLQASASITLTGTLQARFSDSSWSLDTSGRLRWSARGAIAGRSQSFGDSYSVDLTVDSAGIEAAVREWKWPGTNTVIIPADRDRRFNRAYEPPTERPSALILAPPRSASLALAPNVRAPAASTGLAGPRVHSQDVIVTLGGTIERASGTLSLLGTLPPGLRPNGMLSFGALQTPRATREGPVAVEVLPTGEVRLASPSTTITAVSLEGISFTRAPDAGSALPLASGCRATGGAHEAPTVVGRGYFVRTQGAVTCTGTIERIARLPSELRRTERTLTWELMTSHGAIQVNLTDDGWLTWESGPRNFTWVSLSGLELTTAPWARRVLDPASNVEHGDGNMLGARIQRYGGLVWLQGRLERGSANVTKLAPLPIGSRPSSTRVFHVSQTYGKTARLEVRANGDVVISGADPERTVSLTGVRFYLDDTSELALLRQAMVDFAKGIENPDMRNSWGNAEGAWLDAVRASTTIAQLRAQLTALVGHMNSDSTRRTFDGVKTAWLARVAAATEPAQLARELRTLESHMERGALTDTWDDVDSAWRAELDGYAAPAP